MQVWIRPKLKERIFMGQKVLATEGYNMYLPTCWVAAVQMVASGRLQ